MQYTILLSSSQAKTLIIFCFDKSLFDNKLGGFFQQLIEKILMTSMITTQTKTGLILKPCVLRAD